MTSSTQKLHTISTDTRSPTDFALEHAEYLARGAEQLLSSINALAKLRDQVEQDTDNEMGDHADILSDAETQLSEAAKGLQSDIYEFRKRRDRAQATAPASADNASSGEVPIAPLYCPITGSKFWGNVEHPQLGKVALYGGPFDSFTIPKVDIDGELRSERYDQDAGRWVEGGQPVGWCYADQQGEAMTLAPSASAVTADSKLAQQEAP